MLVTGGAGYIGSHTVKALRAAGRDVVVLDNLAAGHRAAVAGVPLVEAGIADTRAVRDALRGHAVTAVMHFAASASVGESVADPHAYYANNVADTLALLGVLRDESVRHLVFSSSAAVYGVPEETPIGEGHPTRPINPYGETKLAVERALPHYETRVRPRRDSTALLQRVGGGSGRHSRRGPPARAPRHSQGDCGRTGGPRFEVFGADYATPDGTCLRDYVHVSDLADAHVLSLAALESGRPARAYNVGTGRPHSVLDVLASVERVTGRSPARAISAGGPAIHRFCTPRASGSGASWAGARASPISTRSWRRRGAGTAHTPAATPKRRRSPEGRAVAHPLERARALRQALSGAARSRRGGDGGVQGGEPAASSTCSGRC